jgi:ribonuclease P protein component
LTSREFHFPKRFRINDAREFDRVFKEATLRRRHGALRIAVVANRIRTARLGLVVGKRVVSDAHDRNRFRRVLRETFRKKRAQLPAVDLVVQVVRNDVSNAALRASFDSLLEDLQEGSR